MAESFISLVVSSILKTHGGRMNELAVILPNKRSGLLLRNEMLRQIREVSWSPAIYTIDDWLVEVSGLTKTDRLTDLIFLYRAAKSHLSSIGSPGNFMDAGALMLNDFEDVDKYLAEPAQVFRTLNEYRKMSAWFDPASDPDMKEHLRLFWESFGAGRSAHQESWLTFWEEMYPVYSDFTGALAAAGMGTTGMCYRKAAGMLSDDPRKCLKHKYYVFAGFNILTRVEEEVFSILRDADMAFFYWDYHPGFLVPPHEAGRFLKEYVRMFPAPAGFNPIPEDPENSGQTNVCRADIRIYPVSSDSAQVQLLLERVRSDPETGRGIILSDENLFPELINLWPDREVKVNVTAGFPVGNTRAAGFLSALAILYFQLNPAVQEEMCPVRLLRSLDRHPWTSHFLSSDDLEWLGTVSTRYPDAVPAEHIRRSGSLASLIGTQRLPSDYAAHLSVLFSSVPARIPDLEESESVACQLIREQLDRMTDRFARFDFDPDPLAINRMVREWILTGKVSLKTEREANNQVTGILETRLMDFEEVNVLSLNEGAWPSRQLSGSYIPYSIRRMFQLPTPESRDAMYAYYFYRLITRCQRLNLYYLTGRSEGAGSSLEKSRYITQLEFEYGSRVKTYYEPAVQVRGPVQEGAILKSDQVMDVLARYLDGAEGGKYLSPSAVNDYLDCGYKFALKKIYGMKEPKEADLVSGPKGFGILIHEVMKRLYSPWVESGQVPGTAWYGELLEHPGKLSDLIKGVYANMPGIPPARMPGGKELLGLEVVGQYLHALLNFDQANRPLRFVGIEHSLVSALPVEVNGRELQIRVGGIIDRIDRVGEGVRIIDYKTGKPDLKAAMPGNLFTREAERRAREVMQVLIYCELFLRETNEGSPLVPVLFRIGQFRSGDFDYRIVIDGEASEYSKVRDGFLAGFTAVLRDLFDPGLPFQQRENSAGCRNCAFLQHCRR